MATWTAGTNDSVSRAYVAFDMYVVSDDYANNGSLVHITIGIFDNNGSYGGYGTGSWTIGVNGSQINSGSVSYDFSGSGPGWIWGGDVWVGHNADGSKYVDGWASFSGSSPVGSATASGGFSLTDFSYPPAAPSLASLTRSSNGATMSMTANVPSSIATVDNYYFRYSTDNINWNAVGYTGSSATSITNWTVPDPTVGYYISAQAHSSEGWSGGGASSFFAGIPSAPASITTSRTARNVTVTITASPSNGGATISGYKVQYSSDGGTTWSTAQDISSLSYTYTGLTPALTYTFRAYSTNSTGNSAFATSYGVFVPASGKRYDGTTWQSMTTAKRFDGTAWNDIATGARNDGTNWVYLS